MNHVESFKEKNISIEKKVTTKLNGQISLPQSTTHGLAIVIRAGTQNLNLTPSMFSQVVQ